MLSAVRAIFAPNTDLMQDVWIRRHFKLGIKENFLNAVDITDSRENNMLMYPVSLHFQTDRVEKGTDVKWLICATTEKKAKGEVRAQSLFDALLTNDIYLICTPPPSPG